MLFRITAFKGEEEIYTLSLYGWCCGIQVKLPAVAQAFYVGTGSFPSCFNSNLILLNVPGKATEDDLPSVCQTWRKLLEPSSWVLASGFGSA